MRSFLTMFGIIWGITSVILLVGLGKGFSRDQKERMKTIGVDLAIIWGGRTSEQAGGYAAGRVVRLSVRDAILIKQEAYLIKTVSPELRRSVSEVSRYNAASRPVRGVWPDSGPGTPAGRFERWTFALGANATRVPDAHDTTPPGVCP
jgi:putative ABC transport system permease protein